MNLHPKYRGRKDVEDQRRPKKQLTTLGSREEKYSRDFSNYFRSVEKKTLPKKFNSFASSFNFIGRQGSKVKYTMVITGGPCQVLEICVIKTQDNSRFWLFQDK